MSNSSKTTKWWYVTMWDMDYDYEQLISLGQISFCRVGGVELCPTSDKPHKHVIMRTHNSKPKTKTGFGWVAKQIKRVECHTHPDVDWMKGDIPQGTAYGSKDDEEECRTIDYGVMPAQGTRTDLELIKDEVLEGKQTVEKIACEQPNIYHQYGRTLSKIEDIALRRKFRTWMTTCEWIYGPTGTGKSHKAFENYDPESHYLYPNDNGWWDGYNGQEIVIINEFRGEIKYSELLDLIDKWPKTVKRRNREPVPFLSRHIIITSSLPPDEVYSNLSMRDSMEQLYRRITLTELPKKEIAPKWSRVILET